MKKVLKFVSVVLLICMLVPEMWMFAASAPSYAGMTMDGYTATLSFKNVGSGLTTDDSTDKNITGFQIRYKGNWIDVTASIISETEIRLSYTQSYESVRYVGDSVCASNGAKLLEFTAQCLKKEADNGYFRMSFDSTGWDIYTPFASSGYAYRYGPSFIDYGNGTIDAWFSCKGVSAAGELDYISYKRSNDGGVTWGKEKIVLSPTGLSKDRMSCCDPGVIYFGGYYYIGYTSTLDKKGYANSVFVARSKDPGGPYEKWNGDGWGGSPEPLICFDGDGDLWGIGEVSFVELYGQLYIYYTHRDITTHYTMVAVADSTCENWPATVGYADVALTMGSGQSGTDVKYDESTGKFLAVGMVEGNTANSYMAVYTSDDGLSFTESDRVYNNLSVYSANNGITGGPEGHFNSETDKLYMGYAYGSTWGHWATRMVPLTLNLSDTADTGVDTASRITLTPGVLNSSRYTIGVTTSAHYNVVNVGGTFSVTPYCYDDKPSRVTMSDTSSIRFTDYDKSVVSFSGLKGKGLKAGKTVVTMWYLDEFYVTFTVIVRPSGQSVTSSSVCEWYPYSDTMTVYSGDLTYSVIRGIAETYSGTIAELFNDPISGKPVLSTSSYPVTYSGYDTSVLLMSDTGIIVPMTDYGTTAVTASVNGKSFTVTVNIIDKTPIDTYFETDYGYCGYEYTYLVYGEKYGYLPTPAKPGYIFTGWYNEWNTKVDSSATVTEEDGFVLYAGWEKADGYNYINFTTVGGNISSRSEYAIKNGQRFVDVIGTYPNAARTGYNLIGWYNEKYDYMLDLTKDDRFDYSEDITFTAQWEKKTYTITFNANGGIGAPEDQTKTYGETLILSQIIPTRVGYEFKGWTTTANSATVRYKAGGSYTSNTNVTLYAVWSEHSCTYGDWEIYIEATQTAPGEQRRYCSCGGYESREIEMIVSTPELTTENYTVYITGADEITYVRYAAGEYTTASEIKNASDCVTLSKSVIAANTTDGKLAYEVQNGGVYSFWVKRTDGSEYIFSSVDMTIMTPKVSVNGVNITVHNLYGIRDYFIAKGEWSTYAEIKANGYVVNITNTKIGNAKSYTYTVKDEGVYTVLVRYPDGRDVWYTSFEIDCINPEYTENGLQVTVGNLEGVKVIRTAYGEYDTVSEVKKAEGSRAFTASLIADADEYTIQYRENGKVTIVVQYTNGYYEFIYCDVIQKTPGCIVNGNVVTFSSLDDLNLIRYAKGEYTSSAEIKAAQGSVVLKQNAIKDGVISIELKTGTYTFCVQYNDESYNYYVITV